MRALILLALLLLLQGSVRLTESRAADITAEPETPLDETMLDLVVQTGHLGAVRPVAISPDGKQVLTGSQDHTAILWDASAGSVLHRFEGHQREVESVAFSGDGKSILTGSWDDMAILWDVTTGNKRHTRMTEKLRTEKWFL